MFPNNVITVYFLQLASTKHPLLIQSYSVYLKKELQLDFFLHNILILVASILDMVDLF